MKKFNRDLFYLLCLLVGMVIGLVYATCSLHFIHHIF